MKLVFSSSNSAQLALVLSRLDAANIACEVRNDAVSQAIPGVPFMTELWVLHDENYEDARRLVDLAAPKNQCTWCGKDVADHEAGCPLKQELTRVRDTAPFATPGIMPDTAWRNQVLVPAILWVVAFLFLAAAFTFGVAFLLGLASAVWAAVDCMKFQPRGSRVLGLSFKPVVVFGVTAFFFWGFGFVWYLVMRYRVKAALRAEEIAETRIAS